ncbi:NodT family RND efflux system outer membrane lipoprotein [Zymomonas mobilis subsp. mobilis ZM4 = ATCC 31821]|uniref:RND efflux system, outer membrane lipoprotein, NodT family n=2 Tax=Zymomonas mobilis subsp. mobilis TaxID=120045 RepID=Q5NMK7_ZYMMO|nr:MULTISPECIES: TolC family protein [Zymomonas]AAV90053.1 RND efflux system, outer membrane lipoprotein, NodT family [Zymomonas mobilis subsp. mobilis ZM4 = ATCC 31821]AEH63494.1 RND efflux system, outer membrane lipoprotein, NodT family [Zymomonas mobilis subsp. mobilis ATCC 10988]AFN57511.1 RND efflux system, outer membrane lipoprotein, NodT family [Zymomonas mobilis subsp. mobilis ATCC 29191]AHB10972.1 efflux transporter, outer membrane factor lipoprotein, NodT family [Zymomonas mobilis sub
MKLRRLSSLLTVTVLASLTAGCILGPKYKRSQNAAIERPTAKGNFVSSQNKALTRMPDLPDHWWHLYDEPQLDKLIEEAFAHNNDLKVAAADITRSTAALARARDAKRIGTNLNTWANYIEFSDQRYLVNSVNRPHIPDAFATSLDAIISYQVDYLGQLHRAIEAANADEEAVRSAYDMARVTVAANTAQAYVEVCATGHDIAITKELIALAERSTALIARMRSEGRAMTTDVRRQMAQEAQIKAALPQQVARKQVALFSLAVLTGRPPAEFPAEVANCEEEPILRQPIPVGDGESLLNRRPDIRSAEYRLRSATAEIGVAMGEMWPKITLGATAGSTGMASHMFGGHTREFNLGPGLSWQVPNRNRARAEILAAKSETRIAAAQFDQTVLNALKETEAALTTYTHDLDHRAEVALARDRAAAADKDIHRLFSLGRINALPVLDADRTLLQYEQQLVSSDGKISDDQIRIFLALGGGWSRDKAEIEREQKTGTAPSPRIVKAKGIIQQIGDITGIRAEIGKGGDLSHEKDAHTNNSNKAPEPVQPPKPLTNTQGVLNEEGELERPKE